MEIDDRPIIVSIWCLTYNHEKYIRQCLDGFVMQKTNFRFEAIVHEDASTDGTAEIVREYAEKYPDIIKPIIETENQYSKKDGSLDRIMEKSCIGKYVALCEGDDYWIDPMKLQKQVDFLEEHEDYGLVYTRVKCFNQRTQSFEGEWGKDCDYHYLLTHGSSIPTLTAFYRSNLQRVYLDSIKDDPVWPLGDVPLWLYFMRFSKIKFLDHVTGVYRIREESASHSKSYMSYLIFFNGAHLCRAFYAKRYWGTKEERIVQKYRIKTIINDCIGLAVAPPFPLFKEMLDLHIYSPLLWLRCLFAYTRLSKYIFRDYPHYF